MNGSYQFKVAIAGKISGIPVVWHLNDTKMPAVIKRLCILVGKYCADGFIVAGERVREFYIIGNGLENKPYAEIHAPVDTNEFDPERVEEDKRVSKA